MPASYRQVPLPVHDTGAPWRWLYFIKPDLDCVACLKRNLRNTGSEARYVTARSFCLLKSCLWLTERGHFSEPEIQQVSTVISFVGVLSVKYADTRSRYLLEHVHVHAGCWNVSQKFLEAIHVFIVLFFLNLTISNIFISLFSDFCIEIP